MKAKSTLYIRNPNKGVGLRKHSESYFENIYFLGITRTTRRYNTFFTVAIFLRMANGNKLVQ